VKPLYVILKMSARAEESRRDVDAARAEVAALLGREVRLLMPEDGGLIAETRVWQGSLCLVKK
jgi:hypothetical protein